MNPGESSTLFQRRRAPHSECHHGPRAEGKEQPHRSTLDGTPVTAAKVARPTSIERAWARSGLGKVA